MALREFRENPKPDAGRQIHPDLGQEYIHSFCPVDLITYETFLLFPNKPP